MEEQENALTEAQQEEALLEQTRIRMDKLKGYKTAGQDPYARVRYAFDNDSKSITEQFEALEARPVRIAGRILSRRVMGKASFAHLLDAKGRIQIYVKIDNIGEAAYEAFLNLDIGDIVGVEGTVMRTRRGEISVSARAVELLAKSLYPLPEKWHGLKDNDLRYRQRYVDLIANPEVKESFILRSRIIKAVRDYLDGRGFIEVETPILNTVAGGASARPFVTHHNTLDLDMYMRIAPELYLKRLIVGGFDRVYEIGRMFRNEGMDIKHNPEFTMMELYQAYADYHDMMDITEQIFLAALEAAGVGRTVTYQGTEIDFTPPWPRLTMLEAVKKYTGADFDGLSREDAAKRAKALGVELQKGKDTWGDILYTVFDTLVEDKLIRPTFILDYPVEVSPLAKRSNEDPRMTYRFEFFVYAREMGNAYSELNDPIDQKQRFESQARLRAGGDAEAQMTDDDFVTALSYGMPPTGGLGIGIDRLVMLLLDAASIRDVLLFPTMKPKK
ncbi:MAG: lysine--tRNA ligase [Clostridiales bacterium]|jgi:lysyl-tRNA synthetase class 2|nr:lysine--tRNA ligase [Clostridiales bacterium]